MDNEQRKREIVERIAKMRQERAEGKNIGAKLESMEQGTTPGLFSKMKRATASRFSKVSMAASKWNIRRKAKNAVKNTNQDTNSSAANNNRLDSIKTGTADVGKKLFDKAHESFSSFGTMYLIVLLSYHLVKVWQFGDQLPNLFFAIICFIITMWVVKGVGYEGGLFWGFTMGLFFVDFFGMAWILSKFGLISISGYFVASYWPWLFYFAIINKFKNADIKLLDIVVLASTVMFIAYIAFPGIGDEYDLFRSKTSTEKQAAEAEAEDLKAVQPMSFWAASWACMQEGAWETMDSCRNKKMFPPKEDEGLISTTYKKEPMVVSLSEDVLFGKTSITPDLQTNFLLNIISPRKAIDVSFECTVQGRRIKSPCTGSIVPNKTLENLKYTVPPEKFSCSPNPSLCDTSEAGDYTFTIQAIIEKIATEASLESLFVGESVLAGYIADYSDPKNKNPPIWRDLNNDGETDASEIEQGNKALLKLEEGWFPNLKDEVSRAYPSGIVTSMSDPDLSQLALSVSTQILNTAKVGSNFELSIGLRNTKDDSKIKSIDGLEVEIPEGLTKSDVGCENFVFSERVNPDTEKKVGVLTIDDKYLKGIASKIGSIEKSAKATRLVSCILNVSSLAFLNSPNQVESKFFKGKITYSQIIKKDFKRTQEKNDEAVIDATYVNINVGSDKALVESNPDIVNKIKSLAAKHGIPADVAVALAIQESRLVHQNPITKVITNNNGQDWGIMQINIGNSKEGCFDSSATKTGMCAVDSCQGTNVKSSESCNIEAAMKLLSEKYKTFRSGITVCGKTYTEWDAAIRGYNGVNPPCDSNIANYVEEVNQRREVIIV